MIRPDEQADSAKADSMHPAISGFSSLTPVSWPTPVFGEAAAPATQGFESLLSKTWQDTQSITASANASIEQGLVADDLSMVETFTAMREADVALRLMLQIRNKLVDAYQELQQIRF